MSTLPIEIIQLIIDFAVIECEIPLNILNKISHYAVTHVRKQRFGSLQFYDNHLHIDNRRLDLNKLLGYLDWSFEVGLELNMNLYLRDLTVDTLDVPVRIYINGLNLRQLVFNVGQYQWATENKFLSSIKSIECLDALFFKSFVDLLCNFPAIDLKSIKSLSFTTDGRDLAKQLKDIATLTNATQLSLFFITGTYNHFEPVATQIERLAIINHPYLDSKIIPIQSLIGSMAPNLTHLTLKRVHSIQPGLLQSLTKLQYLSIEGADSFPFEDVYDGMKEMPYLRHLSIDRVVYDEDFLNTLIYILEMYEDQRSDLKCIKIVCKLEGYDYHEYHQIYMEFSEIMIEFADSENFEENVTIELM